MVEPNRSVNRRRIWVVDPKLQRDFVREVVVMPVVAMATAVVVVGLFCLRLRAEAALAEAELGSLLPLFVAVVCFFLAATFAAIHQAVRISNRIAGPQLNIRRTVDEFLRGDTEQRVRLRQDDYLHPVADDVNRLLAAATAAPEAAGRPSAEAEAVGCRPS